MRLRLLALAALLSSNLSGCSGKPSPSLAPSPAVAAKPAAPLTLAPLQPRDYEKLARDIYRDEPDYEQRWPVEFRVRILEGLMQDLQRATYDLGAQMGAPLFAEATDFGWATAGAETPIAGDLKETPYTTTPATRRTSSEVRDAWVAYFAPYQFVERATFKLKNGAIADDGGYRSNVAVDLAGRERAGAWRRDTGTADVWFAKVDGFWRITHFALTALKTQRSPEKLYDDVTDEWLTGVSPNLHAFLRERSASDDIHRLVLDDKTSLPPGVEHLQPLAMDSHPGVVVVDVNGDHFDDLFVWDVLGDSVLLENQGGHGFVDHTDAYGLRFRDISAAAFADLDNDGTLDLVLGRWFGRSEIYLGAGGKFWPANESRFLQLPANVATISLADIDNNGLLDIFFGTSSHDFHQHLASLLVNGQSALRDLDPHELPELLEALPFAQAAQKEGRFDANIYQFGPRNVVLLNQGGGRFTDATRGLGLELYRNTLQAAFADVDGDGQVDLYLANDFAPANLYLQKKGRFVDVSKESGADQIYFGMGASWGDFDNDGDLDLYASAMQSTAGDRIMRDEKNFAPEHDEAARRARKQAARGNTLLRNDGGGKFTDLTALPAFAPARNAQWAYSAQFTDADGDGYLDLFAPNGFFTSSVSPDDPFIRDL